MNYSNNYTSSQESHNSQQTVTENASAEKKIKKIVIFDFDQTLINAHSHNKMMKRAAFYETRGLAEKAFLEMTFKELEVFIGGIKNKEKLIEVINNILKDNSTSMAIASYSYYPNFIKDILKKFIFNSIPGLTIGEEIKREFSADVEISFSSEGREQIEERSKNIHIISYLPKEIKEQEKFGKNIHVLKILYNEFRKKPTEDEIYVTLVDDSSNNIKAFNRLIDTPELLDDCFKRFSVEEKNFRDFVKQKVKFKKAIHVPAQGDEYLEEVAGFIDDKTVKDSKRAIEKLENNHHEKKHKKRNSNRNESESSLNRPPESGAVLDTIRGHDGEISGSSSKTKKKVRFSNYVVVRYFTNEAKKSEDSLIKRILKGIINFCYNMGSFIQKIFSKLFYREKKVIDVKNNVPDHSGGNLDSVVHEDKSKSLPTYLETISDNLQSGPSQVDQKLVESSSTSVFQKQVTKSQ